jgi:hypothetical protein
VLYQLPVQKQQHQQDHAANTPAPWLQRKPRLQPTAVAFASPCATCRSCHLGSCCMVCCPFQMGSWAITTAWLVQLGQLNQSACTGIQSSWNCRSF